MNELDLNAGGIQKPRKKLYYSLRQTAAMLEMSPDEVKRWEDDFPVIKPVRNRADNRYYTEKDVFLLLFIKELLNDQKMSIADANEAIRTYRDELSEREILQLRQALSEVRLEIAEIMEILDEPL